MTIEFDPEKDRINRAKHGLSLKDAEGFDWNTAIVVEDRSEDYGDQRFQALGFIGLNLCMAAFTLRGDNVLMISLRRATRAEWRRWRPE